MGVPKSRHRRDDQEAPPCDRNLQRKIVCHENGLQMAVTRPESQSQVTHCQRFLKKNLITTATTTSTTTTSTTTTETTTQTTTTSTANAIRLCRLTGPAAALQLEMRHKNTKGSQA